MDHFLQGFISGNSTAVVSQGDVKDPVSESVEWLVFIKEDIVSCPEDLPAKLTSLLVDFCSLKTYLEHECRPLLHV